MSSEWVFCEYFSFPEVDARLDWPGVWGQEGPAQWRRSPPEPCSSWRRWPTRPRRRRWAAHTTCWKPCWWFAWGTWADPRTGSQTPDTSARTRTRIPRTRSRSEWVCNRKHEWVHASENTKCTVQVVLTPEPETPRKREPQAAFVKSNKSPRYSTGSGHTSQRQFLWTKKQQLKLEFYNKKPTDSDYFRLPQLIVRKLYISRPNYLRNEKPQKFECYFSLGTDGLFWNEIFFPFDRFFVGNRKYWHKDKNKVEKIPTTWFI